MLTHFDKAGNAHMVDVGQKPITNRIAIAEGYIKVNAEAFSAIVNGTAKKGDVLGVARIAGIMAAKKTSDIIPLCHPISLTRCNISFTPDHETRCIHCTCETACNGQTGVEMEALHAVSAALLTIYDMCKAIDRGMQICDIRLKTKSGGASGTWQRMED